MTFHYIFRTRFASLHAMSSARRSKLSKKATWLSFSATLTTNRSCSGWRRTAGQFMEIWWRSTSKKTPSRQSTLSRRSISIAWVDSWQIVCKNLWGNIQYYDQWNKKINWINPYIREFVVKFMIYWLLNPITAKLQSKFHDIKIVYRRGISLYSH